jgi:hypothetical protein
MRQTCNLMTTKTYTGKNTLYRSLNYYTFDTVQPEYVLSTMDPLCPLNFSKHVTSKTQLFFTYHQYQRIGQFTMSIYELTSCL